MTLRRLCATRCLLRNRRACNTLKSQGVPSATHSGALFATSWTLTASAKNSVSRFSANEIQTIYLNESYFGSDTFGIESGALLYAHKHPKDLNLSEAALIVGILRSPSTYSPSKYPDAAITRRNQILDLMAAQNLVSAQDAEQAKAGPLPTN